MNYNGLYTRLGVKGMAVCLYCGGDFTPKRSAKYCSAICRTDAWRKENQPDTGPLLTVCVVCKTQYEAERISAKYCSRACQAKAYRRRYNEWKKRAMMKSAGRSG